MSIPSQGGVPPADTHLEQYFVIQERIRLAAEKAGREPGSVLLLGVTKMVDAKRINAVIAAGLQNIGENRVQEAMAKRPSLTGSVTHHLIGALQSNKARRAVELFDVIQSIDREKIATAVDRVAGDIGKRQRCLVEVKISDEPTKSGVPLADAERLIDFVAGCPNLKLEGLMTIGELDATPEQTSKAFASVAAFFRSQQRKFGVAPVLSMGMSGDFEMAIEAGSTMVRVGRALFGERV